MSFFCKVFFSFPTYILIKVVFLHEQCQECLEHDQSKIIAPTDDSIYYAYVILTFFYPWKQVKQLHAIRSNIIIIIIQGKNDIKVYKTCSTSLHKHIFLFRIERLYSVLANDWFSTSIRLMDTLTIYFFFPILSTSNNF